jgi:hypothetical protein
MSMRKALTLLALVAVGSLTAISSAAGSSRGPSLKEIKLHPFTVQGSHFKAHSHVKVTLSSSFKATKTVTVGRSGRFTVTFTQAVDRCTQWSVKATQPGRAPVLIRGPKPQCAPAGGY